MAPSPSRMATPGGSVPGGLGDSVVDPLGRRASLDRGGPDELLVEARTLEGVGSVDTMAHFDQGTENPKPLEQLVATGVKSVHFRAPGADGVAITNASHRPVLASPGYRSAARRVTRPGTLATGPMRR